VTWKREISSCQNINTHTKEIVYFLRYRVSRRNGNFQIQSNLVSAKCPNSKNVFFLPKNLMVNVTCVWGDMIDSSKRHLKYKALYDCMKWGNSSSIIQLGFNEC
jgi:hypothetical protein